MIPNEKRMDIYSLNKNHTMITTKNNQQKRRGKIMQCWERLGVTRLQPIAVKKKGRELTKREKYIIKKDLVTYS